jgi:prepilin-type N-terminal cleavage/methylation domain-containing protein/prepilin-type processing-associated H-X9-DG protein
MYEQPELHDATKHKHTFLRLPQLNGRIKVETHMSRFRPTRPQGFTMIDLLVVIAIIGVLIALLLSAAVKVREVSHRGVCANNLRQLAVAAAGYQDLYGVLPANYHEDTSRSDGSHNLFYGPILPLLPFIEQDSTYRNFSFLYYDSAFPDPQGYGWPASGGGMTWENHTWNRNPFNLPAPLTSFASDYVPVPDPLSCPNPTGKTGVPGQIWGGQGRIKTLECPSHAADHTPDGRGRMQVMQVWGRPTVDMPRGNPFASENPTGCSDDPPGLGCTEAVKTLAPTTYVVGRSDYVAVVGAFNNLSNISVRITPEVAIKYRSLFNWPLRASLANVPDGTSNTLLFAEFCGAYVANYPPTGNPPPPQSEGWQTTSWASNGVSVASGTCPDPNNAQSTIGSDWTYNCNYGAETGAGLGSGATLGSWHPGLFNVAFADGSVRPLRLGLSQSILFSLAGYHDGDLISASDY